MATGRLSRAFTLIEILLVLGVIAVLGGVAVVTAVNTREATRVSKLESDVATINAALQVYTVSGGVLTNTSNPQQIINQLKRKADSDSAPTISGLRGSMIDLRLSTEMQTAAEAGTSQQRAVWDTGSRRFLVVSSGGAGVKNFLLLDPLSATDPGSETRTPPVKTGSGDWIWNYDDVTPPAATNNITGPSTGTAPTTNSPNAPSPLPLTPPAFSLAGGSIPLVNFDLSITLSNPNPAGTSQIYYSVAGGPTSLYTGQTITAVPGTSISAYAATSDPDHWTNSAVAVNTYIPIPYNLSVTVNTPATSLTYAQAGGAMTTGTETSAPNTITLNNAAEIPTKYLNSSKFQVYYTKDGSNPLSSGNAGPAFSGAYLSPSITVTPADWATSSLLVIKAAARAIDTSLFASSPVALKTIGITPTSLVGPIIDPPSGSKAVDLPVSIALTAGANYPVNARIYYTVDGTDPGNNNGEPVTGTLYTGQFNSGAGVNGVVAVTARVYGPAGYGKWFTPSAAAANTYFSITLAEGALVGSANLNGTFVGSLIYANPTSGTMSNITFNSGARILKGNLYLPGTPTIRKTDGTNWSMANDSKFSAMILGWEFDSNGNKTKQSTPRVIDDTGSTTPANYTVTFNSDAVLEGKVVRRYNSPAFPTIAPPPTPDSNKSISYDKPPTGPVSATQYANINLNTSAVGDVRLLSGHYGSLTANNGTSFVLGDPDHPEVTQVYSFQNLTLNSGANLKIVGKVIVTIAGGITINNTSILGNAAHPEWFQLQFSSGNFTANSGSTMYGQLVVPNGTVTFNSGSVFTGSVTANFLSINSNGVVFNLPPVIQN